jgi:hypothetical protein
MNAKQTILSLASLLTLTSLSAAQWNPGNLQVQLQSMLPSVQSRFSSHDLTIGNDWLGGSVHAYAGIVRQKQGTYELGSATVELRGTAKVLRYGQEVAEVVGAATNVMNNGVQTRTGVFRIEVLGYPVVNRSIVNSSTFASWSQTFNLFGTNGVSASVPVGPVSVSLRGNAGCGMGASGNFLLPAATSRVAVTGAANAYAFADARVGVGIPGFGLGVGLQGRVAQQSLNFSVAADGLSGLSGSATYTLNAITLRLYAWAQALYTWTTNLTSWSTGSVSRNLV